MSFPRGDWETVYALLPVRVARMRRGELWQQEWEGGFPPLFKWIWGQYYQKRFVNIYAGDRFYEKREIPQALAFFEKADRALDRAIQLSEYE